MIDFYINGQKIDVKLEDEKTVGDILQSFEATCEENDAAVIGIKVNDLQVTADIFDEVSKKELNENTKFEFSIVTKNDIKSSFEKLSDLFTELANQMEKVPVDLQNGKNLEVSNSIKKLADNIEQFCHVATLATLFPETFKNTQIEGVDFKEFFMDFSHILKDFENALQTNDSVMIGDLSEYEICPRLQSISNALKNM